MKKVLILLSLFFALFSFFPTLYETYYAKDLPKDRSFELVHNYVFDYNFYLSRIREGQEGKWLVVEKYYNKPHEGSLFQIFYLYLGKLGGLFGLDPSTVYHATRLLMGLMLLMLIGKLAQTLFIGWWQIAAYLLVVTAGSWPILVRLGENFRFSTHWGGWSVIDSLQRITFIPHVLAGQIFLVLFIWWLSVGGADKRLKSPKLLKWGILGFAAGIIFPPVLIVVYTVFVVLSLLEIIYYKSPKLIIPRIIFILFSFPALIYFQVMFKILPWKALAEFDIYHRSILPYAEYAWALGPVLPLGIAGLVLALVKRERKLLPFVSWILALGLLFTIFEHVPQQSPTRFTQMLINVPLGILTTYLFYSIWQLCDKYKRSHAFVTKAGIWIVITSIIIMGLSVMVSMIGWLTDQARWKREATWLYPVGVQLVYPLKDFMDGIDFLSINTKKEDIVLAYEAAGNYIPAYGGNFVYLGHANTPDEDNKLKIAARFFSGKMSAEEAKEFLQKERISYIFFGPQEKELGNISDLSRGYPFLKSIYKNSQTNIYQITDNR